MFLGLFQLYMYTSIPELYLRLFNQFEEVFILTTEKNGIRLKQTKYGYIKRHLYKICIDWNLSRNEITLCPGKTKEVTHKMLCSDSLMYTFHSDCLLYISIKTGK